MHRYATCLPLSHSDLFGSPFKMFSKYCKYCIPLWCCLSTCGLSINRALALLIRPFLVTTCYPNFRHSLLQVSQDLGLQCQTSIRLKVVVKAKWVLFEPKNLSEPTFFCVNLNLFYLIFFNPKSFVPRIFELKIFGPLIFLDRTFYTKFLDWISLVKIKLIFI